MEKSGFAKLDDINELTEIMSPLSWILLNVAMFSSVVIVLRPTFIEFLMAFCVDLSVFILLLNSKREKAFFLFFFPKYKNIFPDINVALLEKMDSQNRKTCLEKMIYYPLDRAKWSFFLSFIKALPSMSIAVYVWEYSHSTVLQFLTAFTACLIAYLYFYGVVFIESHIVISKKIAQLHNRVDLTDVFKELSPRDSKRDFLLHEVASMISLWIAMILLQLIVVMREGRSDWLMPTLIFISAMVLTLFFRIWYLSRKYFMGCLENIFHQLELYEPGKFQKAIPLHSSLILARFDQVFNSLMENLKQYREEVDHWVALELEGSKFRALGELSGLVAHDLGGPLHVVKYCAEELQKETEPMRQIGYVDRLMTNVKRALELVDAMRAYLRSEDHSGEAVLFEEVHEHVMTFLKTQFSSSYFNKISFLINPKVNEVCLDIRRSDMISILYNLYSNCVKNFIEHQHEHPFVAVLLVSTENSFVTIAIRDNGSGLSADDFEKMTSQTSNPQNMQPSNDGLKRSSMGLRLIKTLISKTGGSLSIGPNPATSGTVFHLKLKTIDICDPKPQKKQTDIKQWGG